MYFQTVYEEQRIKITGISNPISQLYFECFTNNMQLEINSENKITSSIHD